ncbi:response regulator transcription factor [Metallumcola ferriviriculae]|uniref:Stage 0 sporulation protein A homolog n=1 Tax=Metallumcola ferriviriculae TaxID=3039180 RepID=A0AAU0US08_9FIRM|nr:response regulator transcription factor [Desulfitibacteraceae bacterium MK1]
MHKIRLLLVDDHQVVRLGLKSLFEACVDMQVVGEASSVMEAIIKAAQINPDVIIMDVRLPDGTGVDACREIRQANPEAKVIMLTSFADDEALFGSIMAGAEGYVLKKIWSGQLVDAVRKVAGGESLLDPQVTARVLQQFKNMAANNDEANEETIAQLTKQEKKVLALLAEAKTNREIAHSLYLSEKTVRNYVSNIFRKLNLKNRAEAALFAKQMKD